MLAAATTFAIVLSLANLLLLLGVIKRLRNQSSAPPPALAQVLLPRGETPADFAVSTVTGDPLTRADLSGQLVGFFAAGCPACTERLPEFASRAATRRTIAVLVGEPDELAGLVAELAGVARVVIQDLHGPLPTSFGVKGFPALALVDESGLIAFSGTDFHGFPAEKRPKLAGARG
jgi:hypothetical protein